MVSFSQLWEAMEMSPLMGSGDESRALTVIRAGKDMRGEGESSFWEDFISLCANTEGMAELLDVSPDKVRRFSARVEEYLKKLENHDAENTKHPEDKEMIPTGDTGAFTTNTDPNLGEL
jgi:hypothetical protein